ncbi:thermonuclease family protein [Ruegeria sp. 2205SS24-7]|uniref:thermonuclease family protein n=1 Tax=Ruegeria discodermiae TaxID=3064389 RepID=UPI00274082A4|nr:thermonuclease family protein [Ruegeria sp. 2205SS24-7]MDP5217134.1 thermonuclease family protein [Ruegeria sp. 2205SS24-7]
MRLILPLLLLAACSATAAVQVRDADTIVWDGVPVRFQGVDAPELNTQPGQSAKRWMVNYLRGKAVSCDLTGEKTYDRYVGVCYADGQDIGAAVIAAGYALDCRRYSGGRYARFETPAAKSRLKRARYC